MIKITITRIDKEQFTETKQFLAKETPTEITEESTGSYGGGTTKKVQYVKDYETKDVLMQRSVERTLLVQEVPDDEFNLKAVIAAVNNIGEKQ